MRYFVLLFVTSVLIAGTCEGTVQTTQETVPGGAVVFMELLDGEPEAYVIEVRDRSFMPQIALVPRGVPVVFRNTGSLAHNLISQSGANAFAGGRLDEGEDERRVFTSSGLVEVRCKVYGDMRGIVLVRDRVAWTEVSADGSFRLSQLPPGRYRLGAWVPGYPYLEKRIQVRGDGPTTVNLVFDEAVTSPVVQVAKASAQPVVEESVPETKAPQPVVNDEPEPVMTQEPEQVAQPEPSPVSSPKPAMADVTKPSVYSVTGNVSVTGDAGSDPIVVTLTGGSLVGQSASGRFEIITRDKTFVPRVLAVPKGSEVHFPNSDPIIHNVFSVSGKNAFDAGRYAAGEGVSHTFKHEGLVKVFCNVHHEMNAYVLVVDSPHIAYVGPNGRFNFNDLEPGEYVLSVWHPHGEMTTQKVEVAASDISDVNLHIKLKQRRIAHLNKSGKRYSRSSAENY